MMYRACVIAIPTALLGTACVNPEWVPPSATAQNWTDVPLPQKTMALSSSEASARWLLPATSPWAAYQKMTLLSSLDTTERLVDLPHVAELDVVIDAQQAARAVAGTGLPPNTMWVVDLRGAASVAFGATLSASTPEAVAPVITFNNWPAENELVPAEETLAALVTMQPRLPAGVEPGQPVFLLDAWRLAYREDPPDDEVTDNRYMLTPSDLPEPSVLLARRIDHILYVVESKQTSTTEEDDLHEAFVAYQKAGISISIVDLAWLSRLAAPVEWRERLDDYPLYVDPDRVTIVGDPSFYFRARGGFGGPHVIYGGGHGFGGGHGYVFGGHGGG